MKNIFISRPIAAISLSIIVVVLGIVSITNLSIEQYPDITPPVVEVSAVYNGADAQSVANSVATPIAENIMGVSDMLYIDATSGSDGSTTIQVTFDVGSNPDMNAVFVQNNVASATLPYEKNPTNLFNKVVIRRGRRPRRPVTKEK